jgi:hypothetical protein
MKISIFWDIMLCSLLKVKQRFACYLLHAGLFLDIFFNTEDGGDIFRRIVR